MWRLGDRVRWRNHQYRITRIGGDRARIQITRRTLGCPRIADVAVSELVPWSTPERRPAPETHCQVCGRAVRLVDGLIAQHGYRRPGYGWQTASCYGARHRPYELAHDALDEYISQLERDERKLVAKLEQLSRATDCVTHYRWRAARDAIDRRRLEAEGVPMTVAPGHPHYEPSRDVARREYEAQLQMLRAQLHEARERRAAWREPATPTRAMEAAGIKPREETAP